MLEFLNFLLVLSATVFFTKVVAKDVFKDYFDVTLDRFEVVKDSRNYLFFDLKVRKVNKVRCLVGNVTYIVPYDNSFSAEIKVLKKQGGEYRYLPYRVPKTLGCDLIEKDEFGWPDIIKGSTVPSGCPIPAGTYTYHNVSFTLSNLPKGMLQNGEYGGELVIYKGEEIITIYRIFAYVNIIKNY